MKKYVFFVIFIFCLCQSIWSQQRGFERLERVKDSIFIVENGQRYVANKNVVTVKLKSGVNEIRKDVRKLRSNRLGFIDLSVPEGVDIEDYVTMLEKTGEFETVEYNSVGELGFIPNDTRKSEQYRDASLTGCNIEIYDIFYRAMYS